MLQYTFPSAKFYLKQFILLAVKLLEYINMPQSILETFYRDGQNPLPVVLSLCPDLQAGADQDSYSVDISIQVFYSAMTGNVVLDGWLLIQCTTQQSAMVAIHSAAFYLFRKVCRSHSGINWFS